jgi:signal transduction histidine kinase/ligand-binding sensor domain-containing protein
MRSGLRSLLPLLLPLLATLAMMRPASALDARIPLADLNHAAWNDKDGVPQNSLAMAQTRDGWLWIGSKDGLYRFDGVRFERYPLPNNRINLLRALPNGDLLLGYYFNGVGLLHPNGKVEDLGKADWDRIESPSAMGVDADGTLWIASDSGVHRFRKGRWDTVATGADWHTDGMSMLIDQYDRVWVGNGKHVWLLDRSTSQLKRLPGETLRGNLTQSPDGQIWTLSPQGAQPVPMPPTGQQLPRRPDSNQLEARSHGQFDRDGNLWMTQCPIGVCRISADQIRAGQPVSLAASAHDKLDQYWQLSSVAVNAMLEDREGNMWISTHAGVDRFRMNKLVAANIPSRSGVFSIAADTEGQLWAAEYSDGTLWKVTPGQPPQPQAARYAQVLGKDRDGALLLAGKREITRIYRGASSTIALPMPDGKPTDLTVLGMLDDGKALWVMSLQTGLMALVDGQWRPRQAFNLPPRITMSAPGDTGQLWLSHNDGGLSLFDNGKLSEFDIKLVGAESGIYPGPQLVVAGEHGIAVRRGQQFELLGPPDVEALRNVTGLTLLPNGDRWLNGAKGLLRIRREDWDAALRQPQLPLKYDLIDAQEGYPGRAAFDNRLATMVNVDNKRLWVRASGGLVRLDLDQLQTNPVRPNVQLLRVDTPHGAYPADAALRLPPGSSSLTIQYTAPGLRKPEGMRFQYQLDGVDKEWQDAGTRRAAYYTNVGPGQYLFRVRAVNEDGMISESTAELPIDIAPSIAQTWWFRLLCGALLVGLVYALHQYRLKIATRQITRQVQARMQAGLAERERIARTLHDTFLQSVQGLALQVHAVALDLPEDGAARSRLQKVLGSATRAMDEGRAQVQQLRRGSDPELKLRHLGEYLTTLTPATRFAMQVEGQRRELSVIVQEELSEIGQEALRNAFQHAQAALVTAEICYAKDVVTLRIVDDGKGYDDQQLQKSIRHGRWGVLGMRERAQNLGARLVVVSKPGQGTWVELNVPAELAYPA